MARRRATRGSGNVGQADNPKLIDPAKDLAHYDRLPLAVKRALQESPLDYAVTGLTGLCRQHGAEAVAAAIRSASARQFRAHWLADFGREYPL